MFFMHFPGSVSESNFITKWLKTDLICYYVVITGVLHSVHIIKNGQFKYEFKLA